jgi:hypothetical protein
MESLPGQQKSSSTIIIIIVMYSFSSPINVCLAHLSFFIEPEAIVTTQAIRIPIGIFGKQPLGGIAREAALICPARHFNLWRWAFCF